MTEKKKVTVDESQIGEFLKKTGFVFEMRMNELLTKLGYACEINSTFLDLETDIEREIDIIARKRLQNDVYIDLIIECKQSLMDKWIFLHNQKTKRFYIAVKHLPHVPVETVKQTRLFDDLHIFDWNIPLAHNYICYSHASEKKGDQSQIEECLHKLPKALPDFASRAVGGRHMFFPVALFSGQIFSVSYDGSLIVKERPFLQYSLRFNKQKYIRTLDDLPTFGISLGGSLADLGKTHNEKRSKEIRKVADDLGVYYQIDFVSESGLHDYISMVEKQVAAVPIDEWKLPAVPAVEKPASG
jgi:hypothetical protein